MRYFLLLVTFLSTVQTVLGFQKPVENDSAEVIQRVVKTKSRAQTLNWGIGTRLVNGQSAIVTNNKLEFFIQHRFGYLSSGKYNAFGLDESNIRFGFDFKLYKNIMGGISRSNMGKMYSTYVKWAIVSQNEKYPVSVSWFSDMSLTAVRKPSGLDPYYFSHRMFYTHQLIVSRVFGEQRAMLQISPTVVHRNFVDSATEPNDLALVAVGGRVRLSKLISLTGEYNYIFNPDMRRSLTACIGGGIEFYTSGHVFQMVLTNAAAMNENQYMTMDNGDLRKSQLRFGFNIVRRF